MPEFHANPYPFYRRLREEDPVHASPLGIWVLTRYDDAVMVLRDPRFGREGIAELAEARLGAARARPTNTRAMPFRDPPDPTRLRSLVSRTCSRPSSPPRRRATSSASQSSSPPARCCSSPATRPPST